MTVYTPSALAGTAVLASVTSDGAFSSWPSSSPLLTVTSSTGSSTASPSAGSALRDRAIARTAGTNSTVNRSVPG
ncbi:hypothetical protein [Anaerotruncus massiliensis (ex Liu et al. 2021)]|uniref:hypothetical protein n=1 Tax=Anaerotruncus massiliensis (ex Liu et al. 2021) TaxID=2321404 RepID=UPI003AB740C8